MKQAHTIRRDVNNTQAICFSKSCGCARLAYNWGLAYWNEPYQAGLKPNYFSVKKDRHHLKDERYPFVNVGSKWGVDAAFEDLGRGFKNFYAKHPKFHKKGVKNGFRIDDSVIKVGENKVKLPKIGRIRMFEQVRFAYAKRYNVTIRLQTGKRFISFCVEIPDKPSENQAGLVGMDPGVQDTAVLSDGRVLESTILVQKAGSS